MEISSSGHWWAEDDPKDRGTSAQSATLLRMYGPAAEPQAGSLRSDTLEVDSHWHYHDMHQLMCAFEASIELEVEGGKHWVPRNLAAWIPAGVKQPREAQEGALDVHFSSASGGPSLSRWSSCHRRFVADA